MVSMPLAYERIHLGYAMKWNASKIPSSWIDMCCWKIHRNRHSRNEAASMT